MKTNKHSLLQSQKLYKSFENETNQINSLFKHTKYYYPNFKEPKVITILTNVDYNNHVILADSLLFISLDIFLGKDHEVYNDFPDYVKRNYTKQHLIVVSCRTRLPSLFIPRL